jgi:intraflagellar transport protein 172
MHEKAGDFFEKMRDDRRALESYRAGHSYRKAVDLAKRSNPQLVVSLEEEWGDWLVTQKQLDLAIEHFVQADIFHKAIEAALAARKWNRAVQLVQNQQPEVARPYYRQIA